MQYVMYGALESNLDIHYTKNNAKYGLIKISLNRNIKSNFYEKSLVTTAEANILIINQSFLSHKFAANLHPGTTVLLKGELTKTAEYEKEFSIKERSDLKSEFVMVIGDESNIAILSISKEKELKNSPFLKSNAINFNHVMAKV